jgi:hypothetical protein
MLANLLVPRGDSVRDQVKAGLPAAQLHAITAQHCCSIAFEENLLARDGISETAL